MKTKIIIDVMGGDRAPSELVAGALEGAKECGVSLVLAGDRRIIEPAIAGAADAEILDAPEAVTMNDDPGCVLKEKKDSSMAAACRLLASGGGDAVISAGNTGALYTAATIYVRRHKGIRRAALGAIVPLSKPFILVDSGANTEATPEMIVQFARMGELYCREILGIGSPRVGLLNNGAEAQKGNEAYRKAYALLAESGMNFAGNCEGRDLPDGKFDVVACDGFTGNIALKTIEGMGKFMGRSIKEIVKSNAATAIGGLLLKKRLRSFTASLDSGVYGGAPLLGIAKPVIKIHGSSDARSVRSAVRQAAAFAESGLSDKIAAAVALTDKTEDEADDK